MSSRHALVLLLQSLLKLVEVRAMSPRERELDYVAYVSNRDTILVPVHKNYEHSFFYVSASTIILVAMFKSSYTLSLFIYSLYLYYYGQ